MITLVFIGGVAFWALVILGTVLHFWPCDGRCGAYADMFGSDPRCWQCIKKAKQARRDSKYETKEKS